MSGAETKIFIGFQKTYEIKQALEKSTRWKENRLLGQNKLTETHYKGKEYIGFLLPNQIAYQQINQSEIEIRKELESLCPGLDTDRSICDIFTQVYIS